MSRSYFVLALGVDVGRVHGTETREQPLHAARCRWWSQRRWPAVWEDDNSFSLVLPGSKPL
jgi:hypothetical protein